MRFFGPRLMMVPLALISSASAVLMPLRPAQEQASWHIQPFDLELKRQTSSSCGHDSALSSCGSSFPPDFCCPPSTTCVRLSTTSQVNAALCCPTGGDCSTIAPISCDLGSQNATLIPTSQYHSDPLTTLIDCGNDCCPLGYSCQNSTCIMVKDSVQANITSTVPSATAMPKLPISNVVTLSSMTQTPTVGSATPTAVPNPVSSKASYASYSFSGVSFAAGFVPGIVLGATFAACLIFLVLRRKSAKSMLATHSEKVRNGQQRDTLTEFGSHPTVFGQKISNPTPMKTPSFRHAPEFGEMPETPPKQTKNSNETEGFYEGPPSVDPDHALLHIPLQEPHPWHVKCGTISPSPSANSTSGHKYTPPRLLRQKQSAGNLRDQASNTYRGPADRDGGRCLGERTRSEETISVLLRQTPDQRDYTKTSDRDAWASEDGDEDDLSPIIQRGPLRLAEVPAHKQLQESTLVFGSPFTPSISSQSVAPRRKTLRGVDFAESQHHGTSKRDTTWSGVINNFVGRR